MSSYELLNDDLEWIMKSAIKGRIALVREYVESLVDDAIEGAIEEHDEEYACEVAIRCGLLGSAS